jgi:hypothetical protein
MIGRRSFAAGAAVLAFGQRGYADELSQPGLFWRVTPKGGPPSVIFGYARTNAAVTAGIVKDGERFIDQAQFVVGDMPNVQFPKVDVATNATRPIFDRLSPQAAKRVHDLVNNKPQLKPIVDHLTGVSLLFLLTSEGQQAPNPGVGGTIVEHAQTEHKPVSFLLTTQDLQAAYEKPDPLALENLIDEKVVTYLLGVREKIGPIGRHEEALYASRQPEELARFLAEMRKNGVPNLLALNGLPEEKIATLIQTRAEERLKKQNESIFLLIPVGVITGPVDMLSKLRRDGFEVTTLA